MNLGAGLEGKGVIVTGGAGGIGRAVAGAFASAGARVLVTDIEEGAARAVADSLSGGGHAAVGADLRDLGTHESLLKRAQEELGSLRALVQLAAVLRRRSALTEVTEADWDEQLDLNLKAAFFLGRSAAELMKASGDGGRIVAFASQGWWTGGFGGSVVYNTSKGGLVTMVRGLARTYGPDGITVNCIAPGLVDTPMLMRDLPDATLASLLAQTPLGRLAKPEELAGISVFLASDHASYITGATVNVSGGFLMY